MIASGGTVYKLPLYTNNAAVMLSQASEIQESVNATDSRVYTFKISGTYPIVKLQIQAATVGVTAATLNTCYYTTAWSA